MREVRLGRVETQDLASLPQLRYALNDQRPGFPHGTTRRQAGLSTFTSRTQQAAARGLAKHGGLEQALVQYGERERPEAGGSSS